MDAGNGLWIFGYGSLCWFPGFEFEQSLTGHIKGFARKFWQGNATHRGTVEKPGRVATLVEDKEGIAWGRAFKIQGNLALPYLERRECSLGGYITRLTTFYSKTGNRSFTALVYIATNSNQHWLGDAPINSIAQQITECSGPSGHNVEYVLRLAKFMRDCLPEAQDEHLFSLEMSIRAKVKEAKMCLDTLMGDKEYNIDFKDAELAVGPVDRIDEDDIEQQPVRQGSFEYTSRVPSKPLRCLNI